SCLPPKMPCHPEGVTKRCLGECRGTVLQGESASTHAHAVTCVAPLLRRSRCSIHCLAFDVVPVSRSASESTASQVLHLTWPASRPADVPGHSAGTHQG